ncbi:hypothetical protein N9Z41_02035 [bacterium]|nr:hypothetical protein [bacterium]
MAILNSFLNALGTGDNVRDFRHASRTFVDGNYRLAPKHRFLFHVTFAVNAGLGFSFGASDTLEASFLVKSVDLPKYTFDLEEQNQYNRKRYSYNKLNYEPVRLVLHDDNSDVIRNMWYAYYSYYSNDPGYESTASYSYRDVYSPMMGNSTQWGLDRNGGQFFNYIKIYSLYQKKYTEYWLVNPIIESFEHDRHDYADTQGTLEHSMSLRFETVKYKSGLIAGSGGPAGFGQTHYDKAASPLTPQGGGTTSVFGPGGLVDAVGSIGADLAGGNIAGAVLTGMRGAQNLKGANLKNMLKTELTGMAVGAMQGKNPLGDFSFPNTKSAGSGGNPLPSVPKISGVSNVTVPGSGQKVSSNGSAIQANLKSGMPTLPSNPLDIQSLQSGSNQAFNLAKGLPAAINAKFPNISPFTDPAVTAAFNSDLAKAQQTMNKELPGAIAEANAAFGKAQKQLSQTSPGKIGGNIMAGAKNPASLASLPKGLSI